MNKTKEIIMFLLIFGLVSNALNLLSISATDYSEGSMNEDLEDITTIGAMSAQVSATVAFIAVGAIAGFAAGAAMNIKVLGSGAGGVDAIKMGGLTAFGGLLAGTLVPLIGIIEAVSRAVPEDGQMGFVAVSIIFLGVLSIVLVYNFVEMTLQYHGGD